jgi:aspartyl-tRNA(Asn)/glutamyl-tRNA(Gln) amidotransferase subunit C
MAIAQPLREDVVSEHDQRDAYLKNAPAEHEGLFLVPKVIE